jgi:drug/metabolite transporter (DMT)-like permease
VGIAAVAGASILWGMGTVASAGVLRTGVPVGAFTAVETCSSVLFLAVILRVSGVAISSVRRFWRAGALGLLEPGLTYFFFNLGLSRTSVTHAALIQSLEPVFVAGLGWLLFRATVPIRVLVPMVAALGGSAAVITSQSVSGSATFLGDGLVAAGILCAAGYVLGVSRIDTTATSPLAVVFVQQLFACCLIVPLVAFRLNTGGVHRVVSITGHGSLWLWVGVAAIGVGSLSMSFWLYLIALRHLSVGITVQFLAVIPVVGFLGGILVLGEHASTQGVMGVVVVVASLIAIGFARIHPRRSAQPEIGKGLKAVR